MARFEWKFRSRDERRSHPGFESETSLAGRFVALCFFGLFFGLGLFFLVMIVRETWRGAETYAWDERRCEIVSSDVVRSGGEQPYGPVLEFRTRDGGADLAGSTIHRTGNPSYGEYGEALGRIEAYPAGASVPCYASASGELVLERGPLAVGFIVLLPLVFVLIGGAGLVYTFMPTRRDPRGDPAMKALAGSARRQGDGRGLVRAGVLVLGLGGVLFYYLGVVPFGNVVAAKGWDERTCHVEHSSVVRHESDDGPTYSVDILYRWDRGRGVERSSRYSFFSGGSSGYDGKREIVERYPRGAEVVCWVDPQRSNQAVLEPGLTPLAALVALPIAVIGAGVFMIRYGRRSVVRRRRVRERAEHGLAPFPLDDAIFEVLPPFESETGPTELEAASSRWGRLAGIVFATLFWNGIVSVFAHEVWSGHAKGDPDWGLTLFLVPFVLVGLALPLGIVHSLMVLRNARPRLVVSSSSPRLGERLELQWSVEGSTSALSRVRIGLVGIEKATYRVGTRSHTREEVFFDRELCDVPAPACALGGTASIELPTAAIHSLKAPNNEIVWELRFAGEIRRWPDVSESYPLVVLPPALDRRKEERW